MKIFGFVDQYDEIAQLHGLAAAELRSRDESLEQPVRRWLAVAGGAVVGTATVLLRPDQRRFVSFAGEAAAIGPLVETMATELDEDIYASVDQSDQLERLQGVGFESEVASEQFKVRFDAVLASLRRAQLPAGWSAISARAVDADRLFALDNTIRSGIRGMEQWQGNWAWFRDELADPAAYLVAVDGKTNEYAGLVRIWRNPTGPRFGLIGVTKAYRGTRLGPGLLRLALAAAAEWGHPTFIAETGLENRHFHARLSKVAAASLGIRHQLVLRR